MSFDRLSVDRPDAELIAEPLGRYFCRRHMGALAHDDDIGD